jgi:hypothetical protein
MSSFCVHFSDLGFLNGYVFKANSGLRTDFSPNLNSSSRRGTPWAGLLRTRSHSGS